MRYSTESLPNINGANRESYYCPLLISLRLTYYFSDFYATFHHIGVLDTREAYLERLDRFAAVIQDRERRLLEFLQDPRSLDEVAEHRFVYRPHDPVPFAEPVERRSMGMHIDRLVRAGRVEVLEGNRFQAR